MMEKPKLAYVNKDNTITEIASKFFEVFASWDFAKPIFVQTNAESMDGEQELLEEASKSHLPIITPLRPY
jgi:hypothetical protein